MRKMIFLLGSIISLSAHAQLQYVFPQPGSVNKNPGQCILIREGHPFDLNDFQNKNLVEISGSKSGSHSYALHLSNDGLTMILKPDVPFSYAEIVTVSIPSGLKTEEGKEVAPTSFSFSTHREYTDDEKKGFARMIEKARNDDVEDSSATDSVAKMDIAIWTNTTPNPGNIFYDVLDGASLHGRSWNITNSTGDSVYWHQSSYYINDFKLNHNGYPTIFDRYDSVFDMFDSSYRIIKKFKTQDYVTDNHEFQIFPDGHYYLIGYDPEIIDMKQYNPDYASSASVLGTVIQKFDSGGNLIFEWDSFDHVVVTEAIHENLGSFYIDYMHTNSIEEDTDGNIIVSHRHLDQITKIDTKTGDFIWRLGGQKNQFTFINDSLHFNYQHDARRLPNGHITVFDNGNWHSPEVSTAKEYSLDLENMTATLVWSYQHPLIDGSVLYTHAMGSIQRFPNGGTFIDWGWIANKADVPSMTEVDSNQQIVWEAKITPEAYNVIYRAHRYSWTPCARVSDGSMQAIDISADSARLVWRNATNSLSYQLQYCDSSTGIWQNVNLTASSDTSFLLGDLEPATVYEWRMKSFCAAPNPDSSHFTAVQKFSTLAITNVSQASANSLNIFPNPATHSAIISLPSTAGMMEISMLNDLGKEVLAQTVKAGNGEASLNLEPFSDGVYLVKVISRGKTYSGKLQIKK